MKRWSAYILLILFSTGLFSQDIKILVDVPPVVTVGEQFKITWTVNSRSGEFIAPDFGDFYKLMGPSTSFSQSTQIVNGRVTSEIQNSYSYYLQATREGTYTIGSARYVDKRTEYKSEPATVQVINEEEAVRQQQQEAAVEQDGSQVSRDDLFVRMIANRKSVYIGEHIVATLKIYSRVDLSGIQEIKYPDFNGFLKEDIETPPLRSLESENVGSQIYGAGVLQRFLIYPQKSGTLEIEPSTLTVLLQQRANNNDPFFGNFFSSFNTVPKMIATLPVKIEVKPLPPNRPSSFNGIVGSISLESVINKDSLQVNEALTYSIKISGTGNLMLANPPELNLTSDIEIYEPKSVSNTRSSLSGTSGSRTFEYVLIPRHSGKFKIPPVEISYFDPNAESYKTLRTSEHTFSASGVAGSGEGTEVFGSISREDIRYLGKDIRYIKSKKPGLRITGNSLVARSSFIMIYPAAMILFIVIIFLRREHVKRNSDLTKVKNRRAGKLASDRLKKASVFMKNNEGEKFYSEVLKALWGYLSDKLGIPVSELTREASVEALKKANIHPEIVQALSDIIETCEFSQYAPAGGQTAIQEAFTRARTIIREIENSK